MYLTSCDKTIVEKNRIYICIFESLLIAQINNFVNQLYFNKIFTKKLFSDILFGKKKDENPETPLSGDENPSTGI